MSTSKVHLHIENTSRLDRVFEVDRRRLREALSRHPEVTERLRVSIGTDGENLARNLRTADAVLCSNLPHEDLARRAPRLRWVHVHGAGVNHLMPLDWLPPRVVLTNSRGVHGRRATEYAAMAILMLNNRVPEMVTHQRAHRWQQCFNTSIDGKTLLVIGVGHIGGGVARWAKSMGMRVIGVRRSGRRHRHVDEMHTPDALRKLLPRADFVLMSTPHTDATHHLLGAAELALLKKGAGLLNYSRANCVDYEALRVRLKAGEMSAVLDVFAPEPLPGSSPLWNTPNLIITPHCSSDDCDYYTPRTLDLVLDNMRRFMAGKPLLNRVRRDLQY